MHPRTIRTLKQTLKLQIPGQPVLRLLAHLPRTMQGALGICIGKNNLRHINFDVAAFHTPANLCLQLIHRNGGLFKHPGKMQHPGLHVQLRVTAPFCQLKFGIQPLQPRNAYALLDRLRLQRQARYTPTGPVSTAVLPLQLQLPQFTLRGPLRHGLAPLRWQWQGLHHLRGHRQICIVQGNFCAVWVPLTPQDTHIPIAAGPVIAVRLHKAKVLPFEAQCLRLPICLYTALQCTHIQICNPCVLPLHQRLGQCQIHGHASQLALLHIDPCPRGTIALQRPHTPRLGPRQRGHTMQLKRGIPLPAPAGPGCLGRWQQRLAKSAHHLHAFAICRFRCGIQANDMVPVAVAQHQIHIVQTHGGHCSLLICEQQHAFLDHQLRLCKQPLQRGAF